MAEVVTNPPAIRGIVYSDRALRSFTHPNTRLKAIEPGDRCCHCGGDCDGEGFAFMNWIAYRINGHPLCARSSCYGARWDEFNGKREGCGCGRRK
jgi:hypothetical protein